MVSFSTTKQIYSEFKVSDLKIQNPSNSTKLKEIINNLLIVRNSGSDGNLVVRKYIKNFISNLNNFNVEIDEFHSKTPLGNVQFQNIIATNNIKHNKKLLLACHFDSKKFDEFEFYGATDSG